MATKFCKHCGETIDDECVVCPKCGKQVEQLESNNDKNIIINNNVSGGSGYTTLTSDKSKKTALILCCLGFLGLGGLHQFYVGKIGKGILYFLTVGLFFIGTVIDLIKISTGSFTDNVGAPLRQ